MRVALAMASLALVIAGAPAAPASAQARLVNALVHTVPERPQPGDDIVVTVNVTGCAPGDVTVEIYLTTSDGASRTATMMTRAAATTNLVFRTRSVLSLPDALAGWYGVRVLCGNFRPPKEPMANTLFSVGPSPTAVARLAATTVTLGGSVAFLGTGCAGSAVEYQMSQGAFPTGAFTPDGSLPVGADGSWTGEIAVPEEMSTGSATVRSRCVATNKYGDTVEVYYPSIDELTVAPAAG